jgi:aryl-phospho-beta-D-glucosidase BglC (GH1 family)
MTYKDLIKIFYVFAAQHPILKQASWGNLSDYQREDYIQKYPALHIVPQPSTIDNTYTNFNFTILIFDLLNEYVGDDTKSNQLDSLSLCHEILNDFYAYFINQLTGFGFFLQNPVQFTPFNDRWKESVVGVEAQITIVSEQTACLPPFIEESYYILFESGLIMNDENNNGLEYEQQ